MDNKTIENNKLIALFMGAEVKKVMSRLAVFWESSEHPNKPTFDGASLENYKYNSSWNWLMPVLHKINSLNNDQQKITLLQIRIQEAVSWVNLDEAYQAIVDYIEVYNKNKNNG